jgi:hypothetical protein
MIKAADRWLLPYLRSVLRRPQAVNRTRHIILCICDHFEPLSPGGKKPHGLGVERVQRWRHDFPRLFSQYRDADGRSPQHTFFFPQEEYHPDFLNPLSELVAQACGEVEIHLHHRNDTPETLREKLISFRDQLRNEHGLLGSRGGTANDIDKNRACDPQTTAHAPSAPHTYPSFLNPHPPGRPVYGFIHGNWALCNSRPDGDWCGVNEELSVLRKTGCYADFTFPSVPSPTQPHMVNAIYYAQDTPGKPRGHDQGTEATAISADHAPAEQLTAVHGSQTQCGLGGRVPLDDLQPAARSPLLMITGPLALNWRWRKWGVLPRIEHADLCASNPPTPQRADLWVKQHIHVRGKPDWIFIKLHTHGCIEGNTAALLGRPMQALHEYLLANFNDGTRFQLHYVTAREMANLVHAAERGVTGTPGEYRDLVYAPPPAKSSASD